MAIDNVAVNLQLRQVAGRNVVKRIGTLLKSFTFAICAGVVTTGMPTNAVAESAEQALSQCKEALSVVDRTSNSPNGGKTLFNTGYCTGLVQGVTKTLDLHNKLKSEELTSIASCPPPSMDNGQAIRVYVKYLQDHPEALHVDAVGLMLLALHDAFPCNKGRKGGR